MVSGDDCLKLWTTFTKKNKEDFTALDRMFKGNLDTVLGRFGKVLGERDKNAADVKSKIDGYAKVVAKHRAALSPADSKTLLRGLTQVEACVSGDTQSGTGNCLKVWKDFIKKEAALYDRLKPDFKGELTKPLERFDKSCGEVARSKAEIKRMIVDYKKDVGRYAKQNPKKKSHMRLWTTTLDGVDRCVAGN